MISFESELRALRDDGRISAANAERLIALERRELVPLHNELRLLTWIGVAVITSGLGVLAARHMERLGAMAIVVTLVAVAALLDLWLVRRSRSSASASTFDELLGVLSSGILATALGYGESQFDWLGEHGTIHLLILAAAHAALAYAIHSRLVLAVALGTLVAWFGVELRGGEIPGGAELAMRSAAACMAVLVWRFLHVRARRPRVMLGAFDHVAANLAGVAAVALASEEGLRFAGAALGLIVGFVLWRIAVERRQVMFVIYSVVWTLAALAGALFSVVDGAAGAVMAILLALAGITVIVVTLIRWNEQ